MATSTYILPLSKTDGTKLTGFGGCVYLVPSGDAVNNSMPMLEDTTRPGQYYRENVPDGEYKIYIDTDKSGTPVEGDLYKRTDGTAYKLWIGENKISKLASNFDANGKAPFKMQNSFLSTDKAQISYNAATNIIAWDAPLCISDGAGRYAFIPAGSLSLDGLGAAYVILSEEALLSHTSLTVNTCSWPSTQALGLPNYFMILARYNTDYIGELWNFYLRKLPGAQVSNSALVRVCWRGEASFDSTTKTLSWDGEILLYKPETGGYGAIPPGSVTLIANHDFVYVDVRLANSTTLTPSVGTFGTDPFAANNTDAYRVILVTWTDGNIYSPYIDIVVDDDSYIRKIARKSHTIGEGTDYEVTTKKLRSVTDKITDFGDLSASKFLNQLATHSIIDLSADSHSAKSTYAGGIPSTINGIIYNIEITIAELLSTTQKFAIASKSGNDFTVKRIFTADVVQGYNIINVQEQNISIMEGEYLLTIGCNSIAYTTSRPTPSGLYVLDAVALVEGSSVTMSYLPTYHINVRFGVAADVADIFAIKKGIYEHNNLISEVGAAGVSSIYGSNITASVSGVLNSITIDILNCQSNQQNFAVASIADNIVTIKSIFQASVVSGRNIIDMSAQGVYMDQGDYLLTLGINGVGYSSSAYHPSGMIIHDGSVGGVTVGSNFIVTSYPAFHYNMAFDVISNAQVLSGILQNVTNRLTVVEEHTGDNVVPYDLLKYKPGAANFAEFPYAYFFGRWFRKTIDSVDYMVTINQGAEMYAKVSGTTSVTAVLKDISSSGNTPYLSVSIDGGAYTRLLVSNEVILASSLTTDEHYIRIIVSGLQESDAKWVNGQGFAIKSITIDPGGTIEPVIPGNRFGIFYGDSITEGINVLGTGAIPANNCAEKAYAYITCQELNAACIRVGFGASGVTHGGSGGVPKCLTNIDYMLWGIKEVAQYPDFIVINHGTNDSSATDELFTTEYTNVITRLQFKYPGVPIFAVRPYNGAKSNIIKSIAEAHKNVFYVDTLGWGVTYTDGLHPDAAGGLVAGTKLADEIKAVLGSSFFL